MHESQENYLETILILENKMGSVRSIDIATELNYSKPSISRAVGILKKNGMITMEKDGRILLTKKGRESANAIYERHLLLTRFLADTLGVDEEIAARDACRIEHVISPETFSKVRELLSARLDASTT